MTTMTEGNVQELAEQLFKNLERRQRPNSDETFVTIREDAPEWVQPVVFAAHGDFLPDDWRNEAIRSAAAALADGADPDDGGEWADSQVDTYNAARYAWLASNINRAGYCDEAQEAGIASESASVAELIGAGQYMEASEVWSLLVQALREVEL